MQEHEEDIETNLTITAQFTVTTAPAARKSDQDSCVVRLSKLLTSAAVRNFEKEAYFTQNATMFMVNSNYQFYLGIIASSFVSKFRYNDEYLAVRLDPFCSSFQ